MSDYGKLMARIWSDKDFTALNAREQQVFMLLLSYPTRNLAGVLPVTLRRWANATADATQDTVRAALVRLAETRFVVIDWDTEEALVRSYIRNDEVYRQPNLMKACIKDVLKIESQVLKNAVAAELNRLPSHRNDEHTLAIAKSLLETPTEGFREPIVDAIVEPMPEGCGVGGYVSGVLATPDTEHLQPAPAPAAAPIERPTMSLTKLTGGIETAPPPPPPDLGISSEAYRFVDHHGAKRLPGASRTSLAQQASQMAKQGIDRGDIKAGLEKWFAKSGVGPTVFTSMVADAIKERTTARPQLRGADKKAADWQALKQQRRQQ